MNCDIHTVPTIEYRVALITPPHPGVLVHSKNQIWRLPRVRISTNLRHTPQLVREIDAVWNTRALIVDRVSAPETEAPCIVARILAGNMPKNLILMPIHLIGEDEFSLEERQTTEEILSGTRQSLFGRLAWIEELRAWIRFVTGRNVEPVSCVRQYVAESDFSLLQLPANDGRNFWFKAAKERNHHEPGVTALLSRLCPDLVSKVIAVKPEWHGFLMESSATARRYESMELSDLVPALLASSCALAHLQLSLIPHVETLVEAGTFDQRVARLRSEAPRLFDKIAEAMSLQTSTKAPRLEPVDLTWLQAKFEECCLRIEDLNIPPTLVHGDLSDGNILFDEGKIRFIDWCEAYVGFPFANLQHLLLLNPFSDEGRKQVLDRQMTEAYASVFAQSFKPESIQFAVDTMPMMAAASTMFGRGDWLSTPLAATPTRALYVRTLARHMMRCAQNLAIPDSGNEIGHPIPAQQSEVA